MPPQELVSKPTPETANTAKMQSPVDANSPLPDNSRCPICLEEVVESKVVDEVHLHLLTFLDVEIELFTPCLRCVYEQIHT